jgi:hypothetical protein
MEIELATTIVWKFSEKELPDNERGVFVAIGKLITIGQYWTNGAVWDVGGELLPAYAILYWAEIPDFEREEEMIRDGPKAKPMVSLKYYH